MTRLTKDTNDEKTISRLMLRTICNMPVDKKHIQMGLKLNHKPRDHHSAEEIQFTLCRHPSIIFLCGALDYSDEHWLLREALMKDDLQISQKKVDGARDRMFCQKWLVVRFLWRLEEIMQLWAKGYAAVA